VWVWAGVGVCGLGVGVGVCGLGVGVGGCGYGRVWVYAV